MSDNRKRPTFLLALACSLLSWGCTGPQPIPVRVFPIQFQVDEPALGTLEIRDPAGKVLRTVRKDMAIQAGDWSVEWDGRDDKGHTVPPGTYQAALVLKRIGLEPLATFGGVGSSPGRFLVPRGLSVHPQGALLTVAVADTGNQQVQLLTETGSPLQTIGQFGVGDGRLNQPTDVAWDGLILTVCDSQNRRLARFDAQGSYLGEVRSMTGLFTQATGALTLDFRDPTNIANLPGDAFWVSDPGYGTVDRITSTGGILDRWGDPGSLGQDGPLAATADGSLWLILGGNRILRLGMDGKALGESPAPAKDRLAGLAASPEGFVMASAPEAGVIYLFDLEGGAFGSLELSGGTQPTALSTWEDKLFLIDRAHTRVCGYKVTSKVLEVKKTVETGL